MKKIMLVMMLAVALTALASCDGGKTTLKVFMPTEYIDEDLVTAFEDEFGVNVDIIAFDSNEVAIPQVEVNSYDVVIPSDYAIEELASKGLLEEIVWADVTEMSQSDLDQNLVTLINSIDGFNILNYAVPYFWGNVGLLYDTTKVTLSELETEGWNALNTVNDDVMFYDSSRDMVMLALKALYGGTVDINNPTTEQLAAAEAWLIGSGRTSDVVYASDEIFDDMLVSGNTKYAIAVSYSGDANYLMSENEDLGYYVPTNGTNIWLDAFVVPKNAENKALAYDFINYFVSTDVMYANSNYVGYTAPRSNVVDLIVADEYYPAESYRMTVNLNDSVFRFNADNKVAIAELWARVRAS